MDQHNDRACLACDSHGSVDIQCILNLVHCVRLQLNALPGGSVPEPLDQPLAVLTSDEILLLGLLILEDVLGLE